MSKDLSLADFTKVAGQIGFTDQEIGNLFDAEDIHSPSTPNDDQQSTFDKIVSLSAVCGNDWLDGPSRFRSGDCPETQSARQIISGTKDGLNRYAAAIESAAGGPLSFRR